MPPVIVKVVRTKPTSQNVPQNVPSAAAIYFRSRCDGITATLTKFATNFLCNVPRVFIGTACFPYMLDVVRLRGEAVGLVRNDPHVHFR